MKGASQIKVMAGGGIASGYDPLDVTQYSEAEIEAAVGALGFPRRAALYLAA